VGEFRQRHPGVTVRVTEPESAADVLDLMRSGACEIGLGEGPIDTTGLDTDHLMKQELLAVLPPGTAVSDRRRLPVARLAAIPLIATGVGTSTRRLVDEVLTAAQVEAVVAVETDHREAIVPLVLAGAGASVLPEPLARPAAEQGAVVVRLTPSVHREVVLIRRTGRLSPAAGAFRDLALAAAD
jgi:DNA-binding transcriptional LysR family regulator